MLKTTTWGSEEQTLQTKLQRLLDSYLDQDIDRETYLAKKAELLSQKKSLQEKSNTLMVGGLGSP